MYSETHQIVVQIDLLEAPSPVQLGKKTLEDALGKHETK